MKYRANSMRVGQKGHGFRDKAQALRATVGAARLANSPVACRLWRRDEAE